MRGGVRDGRRHEAALANLVEGGEAGVPADEERLIVFCAADEDGGSEARVFERARADEFGYLARRGRFREALADETLRAVEAALAIPAVEALEIIATDFGVDVANADDVREHADFVLRGEVDVSFANGRREAKFFAFGEALGEFETAGAIDARIRDGFVVRAIRGPHRDGIFALSAFEEAYLNGVDGVEQFGAAFGEKVGKARRGSSADERGAIFSDEALVKTKLLGPEEVAREVGVQVHVVSAEAQGGAKDDLIEDGGRCVDDQIAATSGAHDGPKVAGVHFDRGDFAFFAEETARAVEVAVAAPDRVALARQQLRKE